MKKKLLLIFTLLLVICLCTVGLIACDPDPDPDPNPSEIGLNPNAPATEYTLARAAGCDQLTIYWRISGHDYSKWDVWVWFEGADGVEYPFHDTAYGGKIIVNVPSDIESVGFIVRSAGSWTTKDTGDDRFVEMETTGDTVIYLQRNDVNQYSSTDNGVTLEVIKKITLADLATQNTIKYALNISATLTASDFKVVDSSGASLSLTVAISSKTGTITLSNDVDLSKILTLKITGFKDVPVVPISIFDSTWFIQNYIYDGDDLGAVLNGTHTEFKVWAPTASLVVLNCYEVGDKTDSTSKESTNMTLGQKGVWSHSIAQNLKGTYYTYTVTTSLGTHEVADVYAKAAGVNGDRSMVVALGETNPVNWDNDEYFAEGDTSWSYTDAQIYELHIRDFSNTIESLGEDKGKYLAFTKTGLKNTFGVAIGLEYIVNLGISHIHLLPAFDYASVDETKLNEAQFNWGYDPKNYNVPEGSYSSDPYNGEVRINEFKQMVQSIHNSGMGVIMDVVYNHTSASADSFFNYTVPYYYYRVSATGGFLNGSGCGNETASDRAMFSKYIIDSVLYWQSEYHVDGFRFDLMGLHDTNTMQKVADALHEVNPNAIIYGEGWTMGALASSKQASQVNVKSMNDNLENSTAGGIAVFSDVIRDGLKGSVFTATDKGYVSGAASTNLSKILTSITGTILGGFAANSWNTGDPTQVINYASAHDNNTLYDRLIMSNPTATAAQLLAMNKLAAAIVQTSQGVPFMHAGEEMLRSKPDGSGGYDENSYKSSDAVNNIKWDDLKSGNDQYESMLYYKGLLEFRAANPALRLSTAEDVKASLTLKSGTSTVIVYEIAYGGETLLVVYNPDSAAYSLTLPTGNWNLYINGTSASATPLNGSPLTGAQSVGGVSCHVYKKI